MAKKLGRSELLTWINKITESDYIKIEDLSDGVAFCQLMEAFYPQQASSEMNKLKLFAINEKEQRERNFCLLNILLGKANSLKQLDPEKMSKGIFSPNFEFLQYIYDFIYKTFNKVMPKKKYKGLKRRIEILKSQQGNKVFKAITKYLPSHLITNDVILQIEKDKFFNCDNDESDSESSDSEEDNAELKNKLDKYKKFFRLLEEDLNENIENNQKLKDEIQDAEEEKEYYLEKLQNIYNYVEEEKKKTINQNMTKLCNDIMEKISCVPDDFK